jgi:hypothetical protein
MEKVTNVKWEEARINLKKVDRRRSKRQGSSTRMKFKDLKSEINKFKECNKTTNDQREEAENGWFVQVKNLECDQRACRTRIRETESELDQMKTLSSVSTFLTTRVTQNFIPSIYTTAMFRRVFKGIGNPN